MKLLSGWSGRGIGLLGLLVLVLSPIVAVADSAMPHLVVNTYRLNIRSGPGVGNGILTSVPGGTELPVLARHYQGLWYQIEGPAGAGWVNSNYTVGRGDFSRVPQAGAPAASPTLTGARLVVNTHRLNIRSGPGVSHGILSSVPGGTELPVTGIHPAGLWFRVDGPTGSGWVNSRFTVARGDFSRVPQAGGAPAVVPSRSPHLVVNTGWLNVRSGPSAGYGIVTRVRGGTQLPVISIASDNLWYQVESPAGTGWVNSFYTVTRGDFSSLRRTDMPVAPAGLTGLTPRAVVNTHRLNIRNGPGAGYSVITSVRGGTTLAVTGISPGRGWFRVEGDFGMGWINNQYAVFRGDITRVPIAS